MKFWSTPFWAEQVRGHPWAVWRRVRVRPFKHWALVGLGLVLGVCAVLWVASDVGSAHDQAQQAVDTAQASWHAQPLPPVETMNPADSVVGARWLRLTGGLPASIWTDLQQALTAQGVQVVSIRVLPEALAGPLQSQSVAMRVNASFADWVNAWHRLADAGPVLSMDRLSAAPLPSSRGVQLDVVLRLWFKPGSDVDLAGVVWPLGTAATLRSSVSGASASEIFVHPGSSPAAQAVAASAASVPEAALLAAEPLHWPMDRIRLLGTWQQGAQWQAVLSAGGAWAPVQAGRRVGHEGHKVESIHADAVILRSAQGQKFELKWPGGGR